MSFTKNDLDNIKSKISISSELEKKTKISCKREKIIGVAALFHEEKTPSCKINDDPGIFLLFWLWC